MLRADERMNPVYDYKVDQCGAVYINIGDGGNIGKPSLLQSKTAAACGCAQEEHKPTLSEAHQLCRLQRVCTRTTSTTLACARIPSPASASRKWCAPKEKHHALASAVQLWGKVRYEKTLTALRCAGWSLLPQVSARVVGVP